ncbi:MAG: methyltransferase domain-containing protein [Acetobacteraceae bacterium]
MRRTSAPPKIFDRRSVRLHRDRAALLVRRVAPVLDEAAKRLLDRLDDTTRRFHRALDLGGRGAIAPLLAARGIEAVFAADLSPSMAARNAALRIAADEEFLPFRDAAFDLIIANLSLHWANDLPGALIQLRRSLEPAGLFLASIPVLGTFGALRSALTEAEEALHGSASPRISPFPTLSDCAGLLTRAGFVLPVADLETITLAYADPLQLVQDLRSAGETNAIAARDRRTPPRTLFPAALARLPQADGRVTVTLQLAMMTGWAAPEPRPRQDNSG